MTTPIDVQDTHISPTSTDSGVKTLIWEDKGETCVVQSDTPTSDLSRYKLRLSFTVEAYMDDGRNLSPYEYKQLREYTKGARVQLLNDAQYALVSLLSGKRLIPPKE